MSASRLVLGTAQLGQPYGVANRTGQPDADQATAVVRAALECGVTGFDTARAYGTSEQVLGHALGALDAQAQARIVTKLPPELTLADAENMDTMVEISLCRLGVERLDCLMFHREEHLAYLEEPGFVVYFMALMESGLTRSLGCSVYTPERALEALDNPFLHAIQIPASVFDRRFEDAGVFERAEEAGKTVHIRSALLQGVLCLAPGDLPPYLAPLSDSVRALHALCRSLEVPVAVLAVRWLLARYPSARVLFGAETPEQVRETARAARGLHLSGDTLSALDRLVPPQENRLLNPSLWRH
ncbi:aldo/keto reductase [Phaeovibrio sulfidiphilus]|uniref:Aldo/keto reductase n=1 Tax=Phaeovibrio sulfidiphilus TaxID=1220600 RepID=A0A8J6YJ82_9PROT|nr:aldo/keto reductase [Phaeovibrio sulfidiphilus]